MTVVTSLTLLSQKTWVSKFILGWFYARVAGASLTHPLSKEGESECVGEHVCAGVCA